MTQNLITSAFELVRDVEHGVLLLDTFHRLATREVSAHCLLTHACPLEGAAGEQCCEALNIAKSGPAKATAGRARNPIISSIFSFCGFF